jgi:hypothetical protein
MRAISYWARAHLVQARLGIVLIKLLLWLMAFFVGRELVEMGIALPPVHGNYHNSCNYCSCFALSLSF